MLDITRVFLCFSVIRFYISVLLWDADAVKVLSVLSFWVILLITRHTRCLFDQVRIKIKKITLNFTNTLESRSL